MIFRRLPVWTAVKASRERLAALEIELTQSEGSRICAVCGAKVPKEFLYCGKCGAPIKEEAAAAEEDTSANEEEAAAAEETERQTAMPEAEEDAFVPSEEY